MNDNEQATISKLELKSILARLEKLEEWVAQTAIATKPATESTAIEFPGHLSTDAFKALWARHLKDRKTRKFPIDEGTLKKQLKILSRFDEEQATEIVGSCVEKKWKGIPIFSELSITNWCGRKPAFPPEETAVAIASKALASVPTMASNAPIDRSQHGKLTTSAVPRRTLAEQKADMLK